MLNDEEKRRIAERYAARFQTYGIDIRSLNPGSARKHELQHAVHATIGDLHGRTVLDVGCGLAHYYEFLLARGIRVHYIGYDITEPFIEADKQRFPEAHFEVRDVFTAGIAHRPDYTVMCQVFNNQYQAADNDEVVRKAIALAFDASRVGVSIDMLSKHVNYEEAGLHYFSPEALFSYAKTLTRFVRLRHDYLPFDFTLFLYKEAAPPCA
jgi:SAM-dependent methyltransferase